jgi:hypothetical protein
MTTDSTARCSTAGCTNNRTEGVYEGQYYPLCAVCFAAKVASLRRRRPDARVERFLYNVMVLVLGLSMCFGGLFLFVQFIKWAWNQ